MTTYLLTHNPKISDLKRKLKAAAKGRKNVTFAWSTGPRMNMASKSRIFLMRLGEEPKGIIASGYTVGEIYQAKHWNNSGKYANYVEVRVDVALDIETSDPLDLHQLRTGPGRSYNWTPQSSGYEIPKDIAKHLENLWKAHVTSRERERKNTGLLPEEIVSAVPIIEGARKRVTVNAYERNPKARAACLKHWGTRCAACQRTMQEMYGDIATDFIHVHHITPLAEIRKNYKVDPIKELRPVCPNCHAVLHRKNPPLTIRALQNLLRKHQQQ